MILFQVVPGWLVGVSIQIVAGASVLVDPNGDQVLRAMTLAFAMFLALDALALAWLQRGVPHEWR